MLRSDRFALIFAHNEEELPPPFRAELPPVGLSERLLQKWKSRRMARFLLHQLFTKYQLDCTLLSQIKKTPSGRPFVNHPEIDFNISHSGDWVAVIFAQTPTGKKVAVDIEQAGRPRRYSQLLAYYANQEELADFANPQILPQLKELEQRFYLSWCLREAVLKSQGVGIVKLKSVQHFPEQSLIESPFCPTGKCYFYHQLPFYLAYFVEQAEQDIPIFQWKNEMLQKIEKISPLIYDVNIRKAK